MAFGAILVLPTLYYNLLDGEGDVEKVLLGWPHYIICLLLLNPQYRIFNRHVFNSPMAWRGEGGLLWPRIEFGHAMDCPYICAVHD